MHPIPLVTDSLAQRTNELNQIENLRQGIQGYGKAGVDIKTIEIPHVRCAIDLPMWPMSHVSWALSMSRMCDARR
jgi:hypothetical protein